MGAVPWLIPSKLVAPDVAPGWVPRRLPAAGVGLVAAGPGFGKTLALASWLAEARADGAVGIWYASDPGDGDPATFFHYMAAAVREAIPAFGPEIEGLLAAEQRAPKLLWQRFFTALAAYGPPGVALAIDDAHHLHATNPELLKGLVAAAERLPAGMRVALASRRRLALGLVRLQAQGRAWAVEPEQLRLAPEEVRALLAHEPPPGLDGWPLGVALVARGADPDVDLAEYVAEELVGSQPPERRAFMVRAALLDELTADACRHVFGLEDAAEHLAALEGAMLLQRLGGAGWRFPGYLGGWLRDEAARALAPADRDGWHRRAADFHLARGATERALPHLLAVGAWGEALTACDQCFPAMRHDGRAETILATLAAFPPAAESEPALWLWRGAAAARAGRPEEALAAYEAAGRGYAERGDDAGAFRALVRRADRAALRGDEKAVGPLVLQALARQADGHGEDVVDLHFVRARLAELRGDVALMEACNQAVLEVPAGDNVELAASHAVARINLFTAALHRGELGAARRHAEEALALAAERRFHPWHLLAGFLRAHLDLLEGDQQAAAAQLANLPAAWADRLDWFDQALARLVLAQWHEARDDARQADQELRRCWALFERAGHREGLKVPLERMLWQLVRRRQGGRAASLLAQVYGEGPWPGPDGLRNIHDLAVAVPFARALHLAGDPAAAEALLAQAIPELERTGAKLHLARARLFQAAARLRLDPSDAEGRALLARAQAAIEAEGFGFLREEDQALWAELALPEGAPEAPAGAAGRLEIRLFGGFDVRLDGVRVEAWTRKKAKWALAALALHPRGMGFADLAEALGGLAGNSLASVKMALSAARKALEPEADHSECFIKPQDERYRLVEEQLAWVDVRAFEAAIRRGERAQTDRPDLAAAAYEEALGCYAGELLPETDGFLAEREAFRARALGAAMWLAERHGAAGEPARAEALLGRAVAIAPCEEEPYLALMRHHRRQGRPERVRQAYWDHRRARHAALGLPPSEEFEQAHAEITKA